MNDFTCIHHHCLVASLQVEMSPRITESKCLECIGCHLFAISPANKLLLHRQTKIYIYIMQMQSCFHTENVCKGVETYIAMYELHIEYCKCGFRDHKGLHAPLYINYLLL